MLHRSFKAGKCKTSLKLAIARIKLLKNKREVQIRQMKRDLAHLLETGQEKTAMIRVEHVVREEKTMAAYDLIDIYCELVVARLPIIESQKNCPIDLKEAVSSIVFASPRCADIPELLDARKHFTTKYGKDFITGALELRPECGVNRLMVEKLSARAPDGQTKLKILTEIAKEHNVEWDSEAFGEEELKPPEDLLNGPRVTGYSSGRPAEPLVNDLPPYSQKPEPSYMKNVTGSSQSSQTSGDAADGREFERRSYQDVNNYTPNRENWNMEFKDATSAARAAAESAERASFAAQAAAKLANFNEVTGKHSTGSRETLMQDQQRYRYEKESKQGVSDNMLDSHNITRRKSSQSASLGSGMTNVEDDLEETDIYCQKCSSEVEDVNNNRHNKKSEESNIQSSNIAEQFLNHQPHIERPGHTNSMKEDIRNNSMKSSSFSDDNGDVSFSNLQKYDRENSYGSIAKGDPHSGSKQPSFHDYPSPVFDEPVSDDETIEHIYGVYNPSPGRSSPSRISENVNTWSPHKHRGTSLEEVPSVQSHFNTESSASEFSGTRSKPLSPSRSGDLLPATFDESDGQDSESEDRIDANPSGRIESSSRRHQQNSFNISPESAHSPISSVLEKEVKLVSKRSYMDSSSEDSDSDGAYPVRNQEMDLNVGSVSWKNKHRLGDSQDIRPSRTSNTLVDDKKISYNPMVEEKRPLQSSRYSLTKDLKTGGDLIAPSSPDNVKDSGMFNYMSSESGQELDLGRLRGGFRNKGYTRPPYHKGLSEDNSPITRTEDSKKKINVSSVVEDRKHSETHNQESSNQRPHAHSHKETSSRNHKTIFDSDSDDADVISSQTVGSRGKSGSRISRRTRESPALSNVSTYTSTSGSGATITSDQDEISPRIVNRTQTLPSPKAKTGSASDQDEISPRIVNPTQSLPSPKAKTGSSQNKSSYRTNISVRKNPEPELQSRHGEKSKLAGTSISVEHHQSKFTPRAEREQSSKPSSDSTTNETVKKSNLNKDSVSRENSLKKAGHVHPKLPDYDSFAAHFESLRSSR